MSPLGGVDLTDVPQSALHPIPPATLLNATTHRLAMSQSHGVDISGVPQSAETNTGERRRVVYARGVRKALQGPGRLVLDKAEDADAS